MYYKKSCSNGQEINQYQKKMIFSHGPGRHTLEVDQKKKKDGQFSIIFASFFPNNYGQIIVKIENLFVYDQSEKPMYDQLEKPMHKNSYLNIPVGIF